MKLLSMTSILMIAAMALSGCTEGFPDEEMHLGIEDKTRPFAVVIEPPEAAPGDTVLVTLKARTPDADALDITWRVARDFDTGLYETDSVERNYVDISVPLPTTDSDGFLDQSFQWIVPDEAFFLTSAIGDIIEDPMMVVLAEELIGPDAGSPPTKAAVDAWLKNLTPEIVQSMGDEERQATFALADRFACQVRFRAELRSDLVVDVTRNLTIRHTGRLFGPNANHNGQVYSFGVAALEKRDATVDDLENDAITRIWYPFIENAIRVADKINIPARDNWTYYAVVDFEHEQYSSPFNPDLQLTESGSHRWYYYRQDDPTSEHQFFVNEEGNEAEMWELEREARLKPDGAGSTFRIITAVRDQRDDWIMYHATPGGSVQEGVIEFISP